MHQQTMEDVMEPAVVAVQVVTVMVAVAANIVVGRSILKAALDLVSDKAPAPASPAPAAALETGMNGVAPASAAVP